MDFEKVYNDYHKIVLGYLISKTFNVEMSEELANDVFMRVHKHQDSYDSEKSTIKTWIMTITNRMLIDYFRKTKLATISLDNTRAFNNGDEVKPDYLLMNTKIVPNTPHIEMVTKETVIKIQNAIVGLPIKYRRICNLFFNHQYKMKDIAVMTNNNVNTIKGNILKARKILQKELTR